MLSFDSTSAVMWTLTAFTILLTAGRYFIRFQVRHKFFADDYAHLFALIWLIINSSISQAMFAPAEYVVKAAPHHPPPPDKVVAFRKLQTPLSISFFISHWAVKFSFLFFYRLLFWVSQKFMRAWWCIFALTAVTFIVPIAGNITKCGSPRDLNNPVACERHVSYQRKVHLYILGVNVATDLAIMILPLFMLPHIKIRRSQKIGLGFIFCICFVTIGLEILRVIQTLPGGIFGNTILYGILESNFSVIVSCIPTYRSLLGVERRTKGKEYAHWGWSKGSGNSGVTGDSVGLTENNEGAGGIKVSRAWEQISEAKGASGESINMQYYPSPAPAAVLRK
ncbi:hypothetical protein EJ04DRAFT_505926 [Polyplosphaeria fusca]|uniref:Rhodopsin domain-containing protein n=1 Tax=Polyplosphaeria fusca TaxID=682080 RepID=A0A9P4QKS5_9PLEO|nr:hypothetical protein EJ04DRAFT_505926 [Polyplosphaeria fusca]